MTIRLSLRAVAFVVYTVALLGGAFGISYAVFEWRDSDSAIESRIDGLENRTGAGPTQAELDAQKCAAALEAAGNVQPTSFRRAIGGTTPATHISIPPEIQDAIDRYCK